MRFPFLVCCNILIATTLCCVLRRKSVEAFLCPTRFYRAPKTMRKSSFITLQETSSLYEEEEQSTSSTPHGRRIRPIRRSGQRQEAERRQKENKKRQDQARQDPTLLSSLTFRNAVQEDSLKRALSETMGLDQMTDIQAKTFDVVVRGDNVVGQARTGTGKTLAFLVPIVSRLMGEESFYMPGRNVGALIVAPTRELAQQIASQAELLLTHSLDLDVFCCYGGTKMSRDTNALNRRLPTILVATPGRLRDHVQTTTLWDRRKFSDILKETRIVVLDETDRLLDMGFKRDIQTILSHCARPEKRQVLLFSATIPKSIPLQTILAKQPYHYVNCCPVQDNQDSKTLKTNAIQLDANVRVEQSHVVLPSMDRYVSALVEILLECGSQSKIVVFLPTSRTVSFFCQVLQATLEKRTILEMHSRKSQSARNKASSDFRNSRAGCGCILLTTNVSARGIDYPDVTQVIQYGAPDTKENYIHRLGRTGRAGNKGQGLLVLLPFETSFLERKRGRVDIPSDDHISHMLNQPVSSHVQDLLEPVRLRIASGDFKITSSAEGAYRAFLAYYVEHKDQCGLDYVDVVKYSNEFVYSTGLKKVPPVSEKNASRLKLKGIPGLVVGDD